jgi:hypothetical protein
MTLAKACLSVFGVDFPKKLIGKVFFEFERKASQCLLKGFAACLFHGVLQKELDIQ